MISPVGSVLSVEMGGGAVIRAQVISDGPPDVPSSVWAVTCDTPKEYVVVRRMLSLKSERARYYGEIRKAAAR